jgi:hypothetical protein
MLVIMEGDRARSSRRVFTIVQTGMLMGAGGDSDWCRTTFTIGMGSVLDCADAPTHWVMVGSIIVQIALPNRSGRLSHWISPG